MIKVLSIVLISVSLWSAENIAIVKNVSGQVLVKHDVSFVPIKKGSFLYAGDVLQTSDKSSVGVIFNDGTVISLGAKSTFMVNTYRFKPSANDYAIDMGLSKGNAIVETGKIGKLAPQNFSFKIPQGTVGIRGTKFIVDVEE
ncbi:FecR family protein [Sulfuricurvum sp.]|uniref:FecR family protein n=1 Tax=Sulfuricurvum sp. TaxID=2025608 RepID=UPI002E381523|nr:FecR domain-containing protein [Sulfuricurvum sp.]HEX5329786.1 FecR domain-containing protein [Sulfuricurvum sp.]